MAKINGGIEDRQEGASTGELTAVFLLPDEQLCSCVAFYAVSACGMPLRNTAEADQYQALNKLQKESRCLL